MLLERVYSALLGRQRGGRWLGLGQFWVQREMRQRGRDGGMVGLGGSHGFWSFFVWSWLLSYLCRILATRAYMASVGNQLSSVGDRMAGLVGVPRVRQKLFERGGRMRVRKGDKWQRLIRVEISQMRGSRPIVNRERNSEVVGRTRYDPN